MSTVQLANIRPNLEENFYSLRRRLFITNKAPESKLNALTPEPASISGTVAIHPAIAAPDIPATSNIIPRIFT